MKKFIANLLMAGRSREELKNIYPDIMETNRKNLVVFGTLASIFLSAMVMISTSVSSITESRTYYLIFALCAIVIAIIANFSRNTKTIRNCVYLFIMMMLLFGTLLAVVTNYKQVTVSFIVLLLAVPLVFTDIPIIMNGLMLLALIIFTYFEIRFKEASLLVIDLINCWTYGLLALVVCNYMMTSKIDAHILSKQVRELSQHDLLTGLHNRNHYEKMITEYPKRSYNSISCIYADANNLRELNNTLGHDFGDRMLKLCASTLKDYYHEDCYRIGGDEFVAFIFDVDEQLIQNQISDINDRIQKAGYNMSIGYALGDDTVPLRKIIKIAEDRMYIVKREYYSQKGNDRRKR